MARQPTKKSGSKKQKRNVPNGMAYIQSTFNNSIVTITDQNGDVISWASAGSSGFKGAKRELRLLHKLLLKVLLEEPSIKECAKSKSWSVGQAQVEKLPFERCKERDWKLRSFGILLQFLTMVAVHLSAAEFSPYLVGGNSKKFEDGKVTCNAC